MIRSKVWFISDGNSLFYFSCFLNQNKNVKQFAYIVKRKYDNQKNIEFRKLIILRFDNVELLGVIDLNLIENEEIRFERNLLKINDLVIKLPNKYAPVFRSGSYLQANFPVWKESYTLIHGIGEYLEFASKTQNIKISLKRLFRKFRAYYQFILFGKSKFNRNLGKKIALKVDAEINNKNFYKLNIISSELKKIYNEISKDFENYYKKIDETKLIAYLPISINNFQFTKEKIDNNNNKIFDEFINYNLNAINSLTSRFDDQFSIYIQPHPADCYSSKSGKLIYSRFIKTLIKELKKDYINVNFSGDFIKSHISFECPYELIESFINPDFLLCSYPSASLISSQLSPSQKYLIDSKNYFLRKITQGFNKVLDIETNNEYLFKTLDLITS